MDDPDTDGSTLPTAVEEACFEAGIKFGSLYHQFAGTPVNPDSAAALARAIEDAITNQPHCERVAVDIDREALAEHIEAGAASYTELTGRFMEVRLVVIYESHEVVAEMRLENGYPLMSLASVERAE